MRLRHEEGQSFRSPVLLCFHFVLIMFRCQQDFCAEGAGMHSPLLAAVREQRCQEVSELDDLAV